MSLQDLYNYPIREHYVKLNVLDKEGYILGEITGRATSGSINVNGDSSVRRTGSLSLVADEQISNVTDINNLISVEKQVAVSIGLKNFTNESITSPLVMTDINFIISRRRGESGAQSSAKFEANINNDGEGNIERDIWHMSGTDTVDIFIQTNNKIKISDIQCILQGNNIDLSDKVDTTISPLIGQGNIVGSFAVEAENIQQCEERSSTEFVITPEDGKMGTQSLYRIPNVSTKLILKAKIHINQEDLPATKAEEIVWFKQGQFVISGASVAHNTNGINISVNLKDKMALLNGDCGGTFSIGLIHSPIYEEAEDGSIAKSYPLISELIRAVVKEYGGIPASKIIIRDIPNQIDNMVHWSGGYPIYGEERGESLKTLLLTSVIPTTQDYDTFTYGDSIGYQYTDFTYPTESELSSNAGETVVSVLDKIKSMLGNYEYFFDLNGNFVFQQIENYINEGSAEDTITNAIANNGSIDYLATYPEINSIYDFGDNELTTVFNNNPKYEKIKNDICVWGVKGSNKQAIQYHLVIDDIPTFTPATENNVAFYQDPYDATIWRVRKGSPKATDTLGQLPINDYRTYMYYNYLQEGEKSPYAIYGKELEENWPRIYDLREGQFKIESYQDSKIFLNNMPYFFEIIDPKANGVSVLEGIKVSNIGRRQKVINDDKVNILLTPMPPNWLYIPAGQNSTAAERTKAIREGKNFIQVPTQLAQHIALGAATNSAYDTIRAMLHETISYNESVSITTVPIYHLEPNKMVQAKDPDIHINDKTNYLIKSFNIPLDSKGTMTLQCTKAVSRV